MTNLKRNIFLLYILLVGLIIARPQFPSIERYATDLTNTINRSELQNLNKQLQIFEEKTSNQIVFLMIPSLDGDDIANAAYEIASKNKIGTAKNNNGVLFLVAKNDRKMRIEVGYGLEGALPDALCSSILRNEVKPYFKKGRYAEGIFSGLNAIVKATRGEYKGRGRKNRRVKDDDGGGFSSIIYVILVIIFILFRGGRGMGSAILLGSVLGGGSSNRSGWGGGGGFSSGGGFGGFSGGGGSFGGGGASGGW